MSNTKGKFLSCDWGTSAFRLRLLDSNTLAVEAEESTDEGIAPTFDLWKTSGMNEDTRVTFYQSVIKKHIDGLGEKLSTSLDGVPVIISGMASSTIGMTELPYKDLPFDKGGADLKVQPLPASPNFNHYSLLISGVKSSDDVMRGEETQIAGCMFNEIVHEQTFILPGTHSKHVTIENGMATGFSTYMTGEFFNLLSTKSILSVTVQEGAGFTEQQNTLAFKKGVSDSVRSNLLHASFLVRTNHLFKKLSAEENYYYLSGLLIGTELKELTGKKAVSICLVASKALQPLYHTALQVLQLAENLKMENPDEAIARGHSRIYNLHKGQLS